MASTLRLTLDVDTVEALAEHVGFKISTQTVVRLPADLKDLVENLVRKQGLTGELTQHFTQGGSGFVTWRGTR
jgi:hypothetical protein